MKSIIFILLLFSPLTLFSQQTTEIYNPSADVKAELAQAIQLAKDQNKHILVQVGGNWCSWCRLLHDFFNTNAKVDSILKSDYIRMTINYSPENKNQAILAQFDYPQRFGFPVLLVLNDQGKRLHTQDTGLLEQDKGYNSDKVIGFLLNWNVKSLDPAKYK